MNRHEIEDTYRNIVAEHLCVPLQEVTDGALFIDDLGADSIDAIGILIQLEGHFDIDIPDEEAEKWSTVGDGLHYLTDQLTKGTIGN